MRLFLHATIVDVEGWEPIWQVTTYVDGPSWPAAASRGLHSLHLSLLAMYSPAEIKRLAVDTVFSEVPIHSPVPEGFARRIPGFSWALANPGDSK